MNLVLVRVDDRLIHGQVAIGWTRTVRANHIMIANDDVARDPTQQALLKLAAPVGIKVSILSVADAAATLTSGKTGNDRILLLVREPQALVELLHQGVALQTVNAGNVRMADGRIRLTKEVAASPEDIAAWRALDAAGVTLEAVWLPGGAPTDLNKVIRSTPTAEGDPT